MPSERLTDLRIRAIASPASGRLEIWDSGEPGLILRVTASGRKTWALQFKSLEYDGKGRRRTKKLTLGEYGESDGDADKPSLSEALRKLSLSEARRRARSAKGRIADGEDPAIAKLEDRQERIERGARVNAATLSEAIDRFAQLDSASPSKWRAYERPRILRRELGDRYGARGVGEIAADHLHKAQDAIVKRSALISANRFAAAAKVFFRWAARAYSIDDPALTLGNLANEDDFRRDRFMTIKELRAVWKAAGTLSLAACDFVRFLMLAPQRESAVAALRFSQVDDSGVWTVPRLQKKQKLGAQALPLSKPALAIVRTRKASEQERAAKENRKPFDHVFCSRRGGDVPLQGFSKIKAALDAELGEEFARWRFHDLRRSFMTWAASAGIDQAVSRKILDHGQGRRDKLDAIYNQFQYVAPQRAALERYAKLIVSAEKRGAR